MAFPAECVTGMKVSVCLITRNHERSITQAIESALSQRTSFEWELVIGADCSTDRTGELIEAVRGRSDQHIRVLRSERRLGLLHNFKRTFEACRGQYIALLDGDDYWTDDEKLARQASFLDVHSDCSICFHDAAVLLPDGTLCAERYTGGDHEEFTNVEDLFETNFIATCSAMLRRSARRDLPTWYTSCHWEDWPLYILFAERGRIGYLNRVMSVYRNHGDGLWSGLDPLEQLQTAIHFLTDIDERLDHRYTVEIERSLTRYRSRLSAALERQRLSALPSSTDTP